MKLECWQSKDGGQPHCLGIAKSYRVCRVKWEGCSRGLEELAWRWCNCPRLAAGLAASRPAASPHRGPIYAPSGPAGSHSPGLQLPTGSWATCAKPCGLETLPLSVLDTPSSAHIPLLTLAYLPTALGYSILKRPWTRRHLLCGVCPWIVGSLCHCHVPRLEYQTDDAVDMPCSIHVSLSHMSMIR